MLKTDSEVSNYFSVLVLCQSVGTTFMIDLGRMLPKKFFVQKHKKTDHIDLPVV